MCGIPASGALPGYISAVVRRHSRRDDQAADASSADRSSSGRSLRVAAGGDIRRAVPQSTCRGARCGPQMPLRPSTTAKVARDAQERSTIRAMP